MECLGGVGDWKSWLCLGIRWKNFYISFVEVFLFLEVFLYEGYFENEVEVVELVVSLLKEFICVFYSILGENWM